MPSDQIRVLLIEDDVVDQKAFLRAIKEQSLPYQATLAGSVGEARRVLAGSQFDVIVTDYLLGDGDSFEIFDLLIGTPTIFATGAGDEAIAVKAMKLGAHDYLIKDADRNYLAVLPLRISAALQQEKNRAALQASDERLRALAVSSPVGIFQTDAEGSCCYVNPQWVRIVGRSLEEAVGHGWGEAIHPDDREEILQAWLAACRDNVEFSREFRILRPDGVIRWVHSRAAAMHDGDRILGYMGTTEDVTERRRAEERLRQSLAEKEVLLREIHHRVKNNLQVVTSLLQLQSSCIQDPAVVEQFRESQQRIRAMALIHEKLYQSLDLSDINFSEYLRSLVPLLVQSSRRGAVVEARLELEPCVLNVDIAVPLGLITSELVSNSLKHAFLLKSRGIVTVDLCCLEEKIALRISDNGGGLPENFNPAQSKSLGMRLVLALTGQIGGQFTFKNEDGACFEISFPRPRPENQTP